MLAIKQKRKKKALFVGFNIMAKTQWQYFSLRVPADLVHLLDDAAQQERRTRNNLMWKILEEWLTARMTQTVPASLSQGRNAEQDAREPA